MFRQHLKISFRNLWKNRSFSLINIIGLSLGFASVITLGLLVNQYLTTDDIQVNKNRMYYLKTYAADGNGSSRTTFPLLYEIQKSAPEVEAATHLQTWNWPWLKYGEKEAQENTAYVDTGFFRVFSFPLVEGNASAALKEKFSIVISEKVATTLFGKDHAVGKVIIADDSIPLTVSGVLAAIPANSTIKADVILPIALLMNDKGFAEAANWYNTFAQNYLLLRRDADIKALDKKINTIVQKSYTTDQKNFTVRTVPFGNNKDESDANIKSIVTSAVAASVFILLIIIVNLLNLNAATMFNRTKEVAVRQMIGSGKRNIIIQFCIENALVIFFSLIAGFLFFINILLPQLNNIVGNSFGNIIYQWHHDYPIAIVFILISLVVVVIAGSYPAIFLTSIKVTSAIKGNILNKSNTGMARNMFIGIQFVLAIIFISVAIIFNAQIRHMKAAAPGFNIDNVIVGNLDMAFKDQKGAESRFADIMNSLKSNPYVHAFSTTSEIPTAYWQNYNSFTDVQTNKKVSLRQTTTDAGFAETFQIPVVEGRNFNNDLAATEEKNVMLNQAAVTAFGWTSAIGKRIRGDGGNDIYTVVGILKDFHYDDMKLPIGPLLHGFSGKPVMQYHKYFSINADPKHAAEVLASVENQFKQIPSRRPFTYHFMNDLVDNQYSLLTGILKMTNFLALLTIVISCMGMFGLITLFARKRVREIGIRKVLGASVLNITSMLSKDFIIIVTVAVIVAVPIARWIMSRWLQDYFYRIDLQWWMFALSGLIAMMIALLTVGVQALKAAMTNPVKSLKME